MVFLEPSVFDQCREGRQGLFSIPGLSSECETVKGDEGVCPRSQENFKEKGVVSIDFNPVRTET